MDARRRMEPPAGPDRSVAEMIKSLASDGSELLRQEIRLARVEIKENVRSFAAHLGQMAAGGGVAVTGLLVLVAFAIIGLGLLLGGEYWLSALIVAVALLGTGGLMVMTGVRKLGRTSVAPTETIESVRATGDWARHEIREFRAELSSGDGADAAVVGTGDRRGVIATNRVAALPIESRPGAEAAEHPPRARRAAPPPAKRGGKDRLPLSEPLHKRVIHEFGADDVLGQAAKVAYFMFTSLPPALLVLFALAGIFGGEALGDYLAQQIQQAMPGSSDDPNSAAGFLTQFIDQVVQTSAPGPLSIGLLLGIWAGSAVFTALGDSLNKAYDVQDDRSWFKRRAIALGVMVGFLLLFIVGSGVLIVGPQIAGALQLAGAAELAWNILQWPIAFGLIVVAFFLVYYALPNKDQSDCRTALLKGSAIAAGLWLLATLGFRIYIANFGSYGETYGFVGAILVLLLWMYLTSVVILLGGEIASEMERGAKA